MMSGCLFVCFASGVRLVTPPPFSHLMRGVFECASPAPSRDELNPRECLAPDR